MPKREASWKTGKECQEGQLSEGIWSGRTRVKLAVEQVFFEAEIEVIVMQVGAGRRISKHDQWLNDTTSYAVVRVSHFRIEWGFLLLRRFWWGHRNM